MNIKELINELENIDLEIKRNNAVNKELRNRKHVVEDEITQFMRAKEQDGMKYNGIAIMLESKEKRNAKGKNDKKTSMIGVLKEAGIFDTEKVYNCLIDSTKRSPKEKYTLKMKKIK